MKAELGIPWHKLILEGMCFISAHRHMHFYVQAQKLRAIPIRLLKKWGLTLVSEERQRELAQKWAPDSVEYEYVLFSFSMRNGGEEMRLALCIHS